MAKQGLDAACRYLAEQVLHGKGSNSRDVVDTLAQSFFKISEEHQEYVRQNCESDDVIENAVWYLADVHAIPPMGTDTSWFSGALNVLLALAVPDAAPTIHSAKVLSQLHEGIAQSQANSPISKATVRLDDAGARDVKVFEAAGVEYGMVSALLDMVERLYHGDPLDQESKQLFHVAAISAPLARRARIDAGIDET